MPIHTTTPKLKREQAQILEALSGLSDPIRQERIPAAAGLDRAQTDMAVLLLISYRLIEVDLAAGTLAYRITQAGRTALAEYQKQSLDSDSYLP